jgi:hypothetical protein
VLAYSLYRVQLSSPYRNFNTILKTPKKSLFSLLYYPEMKSYKKKQTKGKRRTKYRGPISMAKGYGNNKLSHVGPGCGPLLSKSEVVLLRFSLEAAPRPRRWWWVTGKFVLFLVTIFSAYMLFAVASQHTNVARSCQSVCVRELRIASLSRSE